MYSWVLWFHILSLISWFAVLFYLPRLFVYHAENADNAGFVEVVKIMEFKIYQYIGVPAMWATVLSGSYLAYELGLSGNGWLHAKILFVLILIAYFVSLGVLRKRLLEGSCTKSGKFFRYYNEVPTLILMVIVAMVIFKPF